MYQIQAPLRPYNDFETKFNTQFKGLNTFELKDPTQYKVKVFINMQIKHENSYLLLLFLNP